MYKQNENKKQNLWIKYFVSDKLLQKTLPGFEWVNFILAKETTGIQ